jgi:hypothetical protein
MGTFSFGACLPVTSLICWTLVCYWCRFLSGTRWGWWLKTWARQSVFIDDDHRKRFPRGDQIVENEILVALITPTRLVFAVSVLKIQNLISGGALVIARRRVDEDSSGLPSRFGRLAPYSADVRPNLIDELIQ